jgi:methylamine---glutamate N-methyltransferase subunit C
MAHDLNKPYEYPFEVATEDEIKFSKGAIKGRPAGVPSSYDEGGSTRWTPDAIAEVHALAQLGRYQVRGYNTFNKQLPTFDDLTFVPATMTRLPLEGYRENCDSTTVLGAGRGLVEKPLELKIPIYIASMSFGALSANAKASLGYGASKVGTMTCTGEGGMLEEERAASQRLLYQMSPARYGVDLDHLRRADALEIVVGQGAKPGTGGLLLGMKVSPRVSKMRTLPEGVDQRSTIRHPDFMGADDLAVKIEELRIATNYQVPIFIKMGATRPRFDVAVAAKAGADVVVVDGAEGGTGASPEMLLNHTGIPTMSAIRAAREALDECGMSGKVDLVAAGGIRTGVDAAKCLALGADAVMIGNGAMIAMGCNSPRYEEDYLALGTSPGACHHCHTGLCPVGIATQDSNLEKRMNPHAGAERVARYLTAMTMEITALAKACGKSSVHNLEVEDLRALSFQASAFTGVKMAGIDRAFDW